ncbi:tetratricopeptide repeat protein [Grimontia celer]|uniref:Tetratricopeptide repeat protein n=1 Tax=Grimontia celer TaxID=1796497 RepID=A0A128F7A4_9GAMM|nr:hypothetical protein [Grimontia celer]CZF82677.1 tetratricopeptide repeat protein [Grimontia celer]
MSVERLREYLALDPENSILACQLVELLAKEGDVKGAMAAVDTALSYHSDDAHLLSWKGHLSIATKAYEDAVSAYNTLFYLGYEQSGLKINCALANYQMKAFSDATALLEQVDESELGVQHGLMKARCLAHAEQIPEAIAVTEKLLANSDVETRTELQGALGLFYLDDAQYEQAEKYQRIALEHDPNQFEALITQGSLALYRLDMIKAKKIVDRLIGQLPTNGRVLAMKALIHMYKQELPAAISTYELACKEMPDHIGSRVNLAWCFFAMGDLDTAEKNFNQAVEIEHNFAECHGGLAVVKAYREDWNASKQLAKKALKLDSQCASALFARSLYLKVKGMDEQAEAIMNGVMSFQSELAAQNLSDTITLSFLTKKKPNG